MNNGTVLELNINSVLEAINQGYTKNKRSPMYNEQIGTLLERFNITQDACVDMFRNSPELRKAYKAKFGGTSASVAGKFKTVVLTGGSTPTPQPTEEVEVEEVEVEAYEEEDGLA